METYVLVSGSTERPKFEYAWVPAEMPGVNACNMAWMRLSFSSSVKVFCDFSFRELSSAYCMQSLIVMLSCLISSCWSVWIAGLSSDCALWIAGFSSCADAVVTACAAFVPSSMLAVSAESILPILNVALFIPYVVIVLVFFARFSCQFLRRAAGQ